MNLNTPSIPATIKAMNREAISVTIALCCNSSQEGQVTLFNNSSAVSDNECLILSNIFFILLQGQPDSN